MSRKEFKEWFCEVFSWFVPLVLTLTIFGNASKLHDNEDKKYQNNTKQETTSTKKKDKEKPKNEKFTSSKDENNLNENKSITDSYVTAKQAKEKNTIKKEEKYSIDNLAIIDASLIDKTIGQRYYLVKIKEEEKERSINKKCTYNSKKGLKMICLSSTYTNVDEKKPATFVTEVHYSDYLKGKSYLCMKANINGKKYKKVYTLAPGTIDHNPSNLKKHKQFDQIASELLDIFDDDKLSDSLNLDVKDEKSWYTSSDIKKLNKKITSNKK